MQSRTIISGSKFFMSTWVSALFYKNRNNYKSLLFRNWCFLSHNTYHKRTRAQAKIWWNLHRILIMDRSQQLCRHSVEISFQRIKNISMWLSQCDWIIVVGENKHTHGHYNNSEARPARIVVAMAVIFKQRQTLSICPATNHPLGEKLLVLNLMQVSDHI